MNVTTRHEVTVLTYAHPYPRFLDNGFQKVYEEAFINPGGERSPALAKEHLRRVQEQHGANYGWVCYDGHEGVFQDRDGLWYAFRHHAKYRPSSEI